MDALPWLLRLSMSVRASLGAGNSVRWAIEAFLREELSEEVRPLRRWYLMMERKHDDAGAAMSTRSLSVVQRSLFDLLARGLRGEGIAVQLAELEQEMVEICEEDIERFASSLPLYLMAILAVFAFPAMMLALIGPLAQDLLGF